MDNNFESENLSSLIQAEKRQVEAQRQAVAEEKSKLDADRAELDVLKRSVESDSQANEQISR